MDFNAQYRLRSASAPVPLDVFAYLGGYGMFGQQMMPMDVHHLAIPSPHRFVDYSAIPQQPLVLPHFHSAVSYPVLPVSAHKRTGSSGRIHQREAVLFTKSPLADVTTKKVSPSRPKMHLFASRTKVNDDVDNLPMPPVEWLLGGSASPSIESSSVSSMLPSENASEDESDYVEMSGDDQSPVPFEQYEEIEASLGSRAACRDLSIGLKALLKVQA